jgi:hypothetical protein
MVLFLFYFCFIFIFTLLSCLILSPFFLTSIVFFTGWTNIWQQAKRTAFCQADDNIHCAVRVIIVCGGGSSSSCRYVGVFPILNLKEVA